MFIFGMIIIFSVVNSHFLQLPYLLRTNITLFGKGKKKQYIYTIFNKVLLINHVFRLFIFLLSITTY